MTFARVVEQLVLTFCETQVYSWRGKVFRQLVGLPIGPRATSGIARIVMNKFDREVTMTLNQAGVEVDLNNRYIDDIRKLLRKMIPGATLVNGRVVVDKLKEEQDNEEKQEE